MFFESQIKDEDINTISLRLLAGLGDAVCHLVERERAISFSSSAKQLHSRVRERVNAQAQAADLEYLMQYLNDQERDLIRRAANMKISNYRKSGQLITRRATAYEVLLGYLYLSNLKRLKELLALLERNEGKS